MRLALSLILLLYQVGKTLTNGYEYNHDGAAMIDDDYFGTAAVDYRDAREMRLAVTVNTLQSDVKSQNAEAILECSTQYYPPKTIGESNY